MFQYFNYTLVALIPSNMLAKCATAIARPWWESYMKIGAIIGSLVILLAASFVLYFEASGIISKTVLATVRVLPRGANTEISQDECDKAQRLDLRGVYDKVDNRFKKHQSDCQKGQGSSVSLTNKAQAPKPNDFHLSNLRNRKGKKAANDFNTIQNSTGNKLSDKSGSNNLNRAQNHVGSVEEVVATYMNIKKDKENNVVSVNNANKKKKNGNNLQQNQNGKNKKLQNKNEGFNPSSFQNSKAEEETSSTTTESSNPDEIVPYFEPFEKEKKVKNTLPLDTKAQSVKKDKKSDSSSNENITSMESNTEKSFDNSKKNYSKKRNAVESNSIENKLNISSKTEMSLWDTPRPPSGEGLSEFAAQTEAFVNQRPSKRNTGGNDGQRHRNINHTDGTFLYNPKPISSNFQAPASQAFGNQQQRPKKPGVIGQPRSSSSASHPQGNFASHSHSVSPPITSASYNFLNPYPNPNNAMSRPPQVASTGNYHI